MSGRVLAVDLGTTGVKVAIIDELGVVLAGADENFTTVFSADGAAEQDPENWWAAVGRCSRRAVAMAACGGSNLRWMAVTSQYCSTVAVDANGLPLADAILWMDRRGAHHHPLVGITDPAEQLDDLIRWIEVHGMPTGGGDVLGQIGLIRATRPDLWASARAFVQPVDYLLGRITGVVAATQNTAFPMLLTDNRLWGATAYSDELLERTGISRDQLPPLMPFGVPRGRVSAAAAEHLGISGDVVAMGGTIDTVTSAVGNAAVAPGACGVVIGTTAVIVTHVEGKQHDLDHSITAAPSPVPGCYAVIAENGVGGKALEVFVNNIVYPDDGLGGVRPDDAFERVLAAAADVPPGANGVLFTPWLVGSMAPEFNQHLRGGFLNLDLESNRADMARAVLEGVACNLARLLPHVAALAGSEPDAVVSFGGGGAASALWGQMLADVNGVVVRRMADPRYINARGAALVALAEAGERDWDGLTDTLATAQVHEPDAALTERYRPLIAALDELHALTGPVLRSLNGRPRQSSSHPDQEQSP